MIRSPRNVAASPHSCISASDTSFARQKAIYVWYRFVHRTCNFLYFDRISVVGEAPHFPPGPILFAALHRAGAVDGFVYNQVLPPSQFLISTQLVRSPLGRMFFAGVPMDRDKDGGSLPARALALDTCQQILISGNRLVVFPEGASSLGPCHLPFKSGAARLAYHASLSGVPVHVVPVGIHYESAGTFRSRVEVVIGKPVHLPSSSSLGDWRAALKNGLEEVGANFPNGTAQRDAESLARLSSLATRHRYYDSLKWAESGKAHALSYRWRDLDRLAAERRMLRDRELPLFPLGPWSGDATALAFCAPLVVVGLVANAPPLLAGWAAGRILSDGENTVALWRILIGVPLLVVWLISLFLILAGTLGIIQAILYPLVSLAALRLFRRTRELAIATWNGCRHREHAPAFRSLHWMLTERLHTA